MWLDVLVAVKDRPELVEAVRSLLRARDHLHRVLVCDAGSESADGQAALREVAALLGVSLLRLPHPGFNKALLLNHGLRRSTAPYVLTSDADILWEPKTIREMRSALRRCAGMCHVARVHETEPETRALSRPRYDVTVEEEAERFTVSVHPASTGGEHRPGCGLVMAPREVWLRVGGYCESFGGWGWEDQDLLVRARLLGIPVTRTGTVLHQSHGDAARNRYHASLPPGATRDANILQSCRQILEGRLVGPLGDPSSLRAPPVTVRLPPDLERLGEGTAESPQTELREDGTVHLHGVLGDMVHDVPSVHDLE